MKKYSGFAVVVFALAIAGALSAYAVPRMDMSGSPTQVIAKAPPEYGDAVALNSGGFSESKALAIVVAGAFSAHAATPMDTKGIHSDVVAGVLSRSGNTVKLYYNGSSGSKAFCVGENVPIFKQYGLAATESLVGEVHITRHIGKHIAEGRLIDGHASRGDVATKPHALCLKG